jgi:hypothetical protein
MTVRPAARDEPARIRELLSLLETLRCVDSTVFIDVAADTFESFSGPSHIVRDDKGQPEFRSKRVLSVRNPGLPGSRVDVVLWTESRRHLRVA